VSFHGQAVSVVDLTPHHRQSILQYTYRRYFDPLSSSLTLLTRVLRLLDPVLLQFHQYHPFTHGGPSIRLRMVGRSLSWDACLADGLCRRYVRASMTLAGLLPPLSDNGNRELILKWVQ
jgi:hypothetical protein